MDKTKKWYIALSVFLTAVFVALGVTVFNKSFLRLWETIRDFGLSCKYYVCEIFSIEHNTLVSITDKSEVLDWNYILPKTSEDFGKRTNLFFRLWIN